MKKLTEHLHDEMLITQIIYKFNVNLSRRSYFKYFVEDEIWLNVHNFSITHLAVKLNDHNVDLFKIKCIFKNNSLIIELNLLTFMKMTDNEIHLFMMLTTNLLILFCVQIKVRRVKRSQFDAIQTMLECCVSRKVDRAEFSPTRQHSL